MKLLLSIFFVVSLVAANALSQDAPATRDLAAVSGATRTTNDRRVLGVIFDDKHAVSHELHLVVRR